MSWFYCKNWWLAHRSAKPRKRSWRFLSEKPLIHMVSLRARAQTRPPCEMYLSHFFWKGRCDSIVTLFLFDFCVLIPGWNSLITFIFRGGKWRENPKCLWWFLLVRNLSEIKFIPGLFFSSNYPKDLLQYKLHECLGFFVCFYFFTQNKNVT